MQQQNAAAQLSPAVAAANNQAVGVALLGGALGAGLGAGIGAATGNAGKGAAIGAASGGALGIIGKRMVVTCGGSGGTCARRAPSARQPIVSKRC